MTLVFYFPRKSNYNCQGTDIFSNIVELLLFLCCTYMITGSAVKECL